jgi:hypothetical protein
MVVAGRADPIVNQDFTSSAGWTLNAIGSGQTINDTVAGALNTPNPQAFGYMSLTLATADNWVFQFDMRAIGNRDTPYLQLSSDTSGYGDPTTDNKKVIFYTNNDLGNLRSSFRYYNSANTPEFTEQNDEDASGLWAKDVTYYCEATRNGNAFTFAQYSDPDDRDDRTSALQEIILADLNPAADSTAYANTPDFAYIGVGGQGSHGQQNTYNLKLWNVYF